MASRSPSRLRFATGSQIVGDRNTAQKHVWRANIVLLSAGGLGTHAIMREAGVSKTAVWRWQERFAQEGVDGLLRDKTRPARLAPLGPEVADRVVALTQGDPPGETTHWTAAAMAKVASISASSVQRIWRGHGLQPHRVRQFKLSTDPAFAAKLRDVVELYVDPPAHAVVLSVDEKSQIQALAGTEAPLPMKPGQPTTRTHDYKRHGTTTLFAAGQVPIEDVRLEQHLRPPTLVEAAAGRLDVEHGVKLILSDADQLAFIGQIQIGEAHGAPDELGGTDAREGGRDGSGGSHLPLPDLIHASGSARRWCGHGGLRGGWDGCGRETSVL